jgi:hypothetical protein
VIARQDTESLPIRFTVDTGCPISAEERGLKYPFLAWLPAAGHKKTQLRISSGHNWRINFAVRMRLQGSNEWLGVQSVNCVKAAYVFKNTLPPRL